MRLNVEPNRPRMIVGVLVILIGAGLVALIKLVEQGPLPAANAPVMPLWSAAPFVLLLLAIAGLPLIAPHWWESNRNKLLVSALSAVVPAAYLVMRSADTGGESVRRLLHELSEYSSFIILLAALYTIAGGIVIGGHATGRPATNAAILAAGAILANLIGTTGASMLLIRPILRINRERRRTAHIPVFFIFLISNTGGLLTPLGDPPLFLGFLKGVDFFWTFRLWKEWLLVNGSLLALFWLWDAIAFRRETPEALASELRAYHPERVGGLWPNLPLLLGVLVAVLLQSPTVGQAITGIPGWKLHKPWGEGIMVALLALSLFLTPRKRREQNEFSWHAMAEVAILFIGIFAAMTPALAILERRGPGLGLTEPWQYFWLTGGLSSFLDNAPTYLTFATLANGGENLGELSRRAPAILQAISCAAVFMGANTYIGNGPNFMVKAIAEQSGYKMPSFFGYMLYSGLILMPLFAVVSWIFFRP